MDRRAFLRTLGLGAAVAAGMAVDPERLGWVKGARTFFLPAPNPILVFDGLTIGDIFTIDGYFAVNPLNGRELSVPQTFVVTDVASSSFLPRQLYFEGPKAMPIPVPSKRQVKPVLVGRTVPCVVMHSSWS